MATRGWIVITTVNPPTSALRMLAKLQESGWAMVVVADSKTPVDWELDGVHFLSVAEQKDRYGELATLVPFAHYSRKNLGYLFAAEQGAEYILETDDDNEPYASFGRSISRRVRGRLLQHDGWVNVYRHFTSSNIWPRGLPLGEVQETGTIVGTSEEECPIQQFLADDDPDVDAIYRLVIREPCTFDPGAAPVILEPGCLSPFNSQNTVFFREAFPLLYLPSHVTFRLTDIWRSFVAQEALWAHGYRVAFHTATVTQRRNVHDLMEDFRQEVPGYLENSRLAERLSRVREELPPAARRSITETARALWDDLTMSGTIPTEERAILDAWLERLGSSELTHQPEPTS